jgi:uncharacterized protein YndB with AHSA1/START domain
VAQLRHGFVIDRPVEAVFDLATTARYWPEWHPATLRVEGDVEHPAQLGDRITEYVNIGGLEGSGTWTVIAYQRPRRLVLAADTAMGHLEIAYSASVDAGGTRFERALTYPDLGETLDQIMEQQSATAVANLKTLLERRIPPAR